MDCWKALTASSVLSLKTPSMPLLPRSKPRASRRVWRSTTSLPLSPLRSVRTYWTGIPFARCRDPAGPAKAGAPGVLAGPGAPESRLLLPIALVLDDPQDVVGVEDHVILALEADLGTGVLGEDDDVALADLDPVLELADRHDLGRLRLLLGGVGKHYPRGRLLLALDDLHERPLSQRLELHLFDLLFPRTLLRCPAPGRIRSRGVVCVRDCNREGYSWQLRTVTGRAAKRAGF